MRTFIAIPIPEECRSMLDQLQQILRKSAADVRWVAVPSIHLTLKFLGEVAPGLVPELARLLHQVSKLHGSISLRLFGLGCFPAHKNPRVVWCGVDGNTDKLRRLQMSVESACAELGFSPEERAFSPHLTLGRVKGKRNLQRLIDCIKIGSGLECTFDVDHFNVYRSQLTPEGAVHSVLEKIALANEDS